MTPERPLVLVHDPSPIFDYVPERAIIEAAGAELRVPESDDERDELLPTADVIIATGYQKFTAQHAAIATRCVGIQTASTGTDFVSPAMSDRGVEVRSAAGYCTTEVADHALTLLLCLERGVYAVDRAQRAGAPANRVPQLESIRRLGTRVLGIVGFGRIGHHVATRAGAFGYRVLAYDPYATADGTAAELVDLPELLSSADAIVCCAALTPETTHLLDATAFDLMRDGVRIVNVSRGGIIREADLVAALDRGTVSSAALDVREVEPPLQPDPLNGRDNVILTPHMAATSVDSIAQLHVTVAEGAVALLTAAGLLPRS